MKLTKTASDRIEKIMKNRQKDNGLCKNKAKKTTKSDLYRDSALFFDKKTAHCNQRI